MIKGLKENIRIQMWAENVHDNRFLLIECSQKMLAEIIVYPVLNSDRYVTRWSCMPSLLL